MDNDLMLSYDGGTPISDDGDLRITSGLDALSREISRIVRTTNPAWRTYPTLGAGLEEFVGEPNTSDLALEITKRLNYVLNLNMIAQPGTLFAKVVPASDESLLIFIFLNEFSGSTLMDREVFNFKDGMSSHVYDPEELKTFRADTRHSVPKNKYLQ